MPPSGATKLKDYASLYTSLRSIVERLYFALYIKPCNINFTLNQGKLTTERLEFKIRPQYQYILKIFTKRKLEFIFHIYYIIVFFFLLIS